MIKQRLVDLLQALEALEVTTGRTFYVMKSTDTGYEEFVREHPEYLDGIEKVYTSVESALSAAVTNRQDRILMAGHGSHTVVAQLLISINRVSIIGMDSGARRSSQSTKIKLNDNTADIESTIKITGVRVTLRNLKVLNSGTHANSIASVIDEGEATLIEDCSIMKLSDLGETTVADFICRADSPTYRRVEFGFDTLLQTAARPTFWFKNDGNTRAKHVWAEDCHFVCASSSSTKVFILVANTSSLAFSNVFVRPTFSNALVGSISAAALADAVASVSGLVEGDILIVDPSSNTLELCSAVTDQVKVVGPAASAQTGEAVTPS